MVWAVEHRPTVKGASERVSVPVAIKDAHLLGIRSKSDFKFSDLHFLHLSFSVTTQRLFKCNFCQRIFSIMVFAMETPLFFFFSVGVGREWGGVVRATTENNLDLLCLRFAVCN